MTKGEPLFKPLPFAIMSCLLHKERHLLSCCGREPLIAIVWIPEFYFCSDRCLTILITCIQSSRTQQKDSSPHFQIPMLCAQVREFIPFQKIQMNYLSYKGTCLRQHTLLPLLEGLDWRGKKKESSELISQSFFMLDFFSLKNVKRN